MTGANGSGVWVTIGSHVPWRPLSMADKRAGRHFSINHESYFIKPTRYSRNWGPLSVSIPDGKNHKAARADAAGWSSSNPPGGRWTSFGVLTARAVKGRTYLREGVTVDGQSAETPDRLQVVCDHLDLTFALKEWSLAWSDHGGLPTGSEPRIRLAAIREHVDCLDRALNYAADCSSFGRALKGAVPSHPGTGLVRR